MPEDEDGEIHVHSSQEHAANGEDCWYQGGLWGAGHASFGITDSSDFLLPHQRGLLST